LAIALADTYNGGRDRTGCDRNISVATAIYERRRLSDDSLDEVLVAAGFTLPRPTA
jgi:hypothetical protein